MNGEYVSFLGRSSDSNRLTVFLSKAWCVELSILVSLAPSKLPEHSCCRKIFGLTTNTWSFNLTGATEVRASGPRQLLGSNYWLLMVLAYYQSLASFISVVYQAFCFYFINLSRLPDLHIFNMPNSKCVHWFGVRPRDLFLNAFYSLPASSGYYETQISCLSSAGFHRKLTSLRIETRCFENHESPCY